MDLWFISKWITFVFLWSTESRTLWRRTDWLAYFGRRGLPTFPSCWTKETKPCSAGFAVFAMLPVWHWGQGRWKPHMKQGSLLTSSHFHAGSEGCLVYFFHFHVFVQSMSMFSVGPWVCRYVHVCVCGGPTLMTRVVFPHSHRGSSSPKPGTHSPATQLALRISFSCLTFPSTIYMYSGDPNSGPHASEVNPLTAGPFP